MGLAVFILIIQAHLSYIAAKRNHLYRTIHDIQCGKNKKSTIIAEQKLADAIVKIFDGHYCAYVCRISLQYKARSIKPACPLNVTIALQNGAKNDISSVHISYVGFLSRSWACDSSAFDFHSVKYYESFEPCY